MGLVIAHLNEELRKLSKENNLLRIDNANLHKEINTYTKELIRLNKIIVEIMLVIKES